jgi:phosphatidylglycerophosphate synthase
MDRRAVRSRSNPFIQSVAGALARSAATPDQISAFSIVAACAVPAGLFGLGGAAGATLAIAGIQLRLLANVVDGLVAIEGGRRSALGDLWNELPDRLTDSIILVSLGVAFGAAWLGWLAALLALATAYVRLLGGALGQLQRFSGPMAKPQRMFVATLALVPAAIPALGVSAASAVAAGLGVIAIGSALTCVRRTRAIARELRATTA